MPTRRIANESMNLEIPLKIRLMPTKVPMTQTELDGHCAQIRIPKISVMASSTTLSVQASPAAKERQRDRWHRRATEPKRTGVIESDRTDTIRFQSISPSRTVVSTPPPATLLPLESRARPLMKQFLIRQREPTLR